MEITRNVTHTYTIQYNKGLDRTATVTFEDGKFIRCNYKTRGYDGYDLTDWAWLGTLARAIASLVEKESAKTNE